MKPASRKPNTC